MEPLCGQLFNFRPGGGVASSKELNSWARPIVITNKGECTGASQVVFSVNYHAVKIHNSRYIHFTGTGHSEYQYGIRISAYGGGAHALDKLSSDVLNLLTLGMLDILEDLDGETRPYNGYFDIGAYEYR